MLYRVLLTKVDKGRRKTVADEARRVVVEAESGDEAAKAAYAQYANERDIAVTYVGPATVDDRGMADPKPPKAPSVPPDQKLLRQQAAAKARAAKAEAKRKKAVSEQPVKVTADGA